MSTKLLITGLLILSFVLAACNESENNTSEQAEAPAEQMATLDSDADSAATSEGVAWNMYCPVSGGPVDPDVRTVSYDGKEWGFCCDGCDSKFEAEPAKFAANVSADGTEYFGEKHMD
jgi:YHS domain-containing protein